MVIFAEPAQAHIVSNGPKPPSAFLALFTSPIIQFILMTPRLQQGFLCQVLGGISISDKHGTLAYQPGALGS
jgi:hypothetical protein